MKFAETIGVVACMALLGGTMPATAQNPAADQVRTARRTARLMSRWDLVAEAQPTTSVIGSIWSPENAGVPGVSVRLRNLLRGEISAVTQTNETGEFAFGQVQEGTYLLEVAEQVTSNPIALGDVFTIGANETVAIFVKLPIPLGWGSTLAALLGAPSGAAGSGATGAALGNVVGSAGGAVGSSVAGTFGSTMASVVSSAANAGVTGIGGGRAASNEDQPQ